MKESTSREKVLKNIRNALISKTDIPYPHLDCDSQLYVQKEESAEILFAEAFINVAGKFVFCENKKDFQDNLTQLIIENKWKNVFCTDKDILDYLIKEKIQATNLQDNFLSMDAAITGCEYLVSRLGSIVVSSKQMPGRKLMAYPPVHIVVANTSQIVPDLKDALSALKVKYNKSLPSLISIITGPSRTADIEKTLVMGAHGPKDLYCFLIESS